MQKNISFFVIFAQYSSDGNSIYIINIIHLKTLWQQLTIKRLSFLW
ncbi:hypothetical protein BACCELL_04256 [Bacteroides cellulosilyticus DSM 14838]|uniref:Uncharacterized protein n=1 Tax=Bacteroides cellulosilyticus DSM 14838 TaxID=537012 RepID=E2NIX0_9BACE|nr:hypothetical protein BACCELL_04256 [Bacteroides cellulosilyticus DSM 14838]